MKKFTRTEIIIIVICLLLIVLSIAYFVFKDDYIKKYNEGIDYSCQTEKDCLIKQTGCNCSGFLNQCVNFNSKEGICDIAEKDMICESINPQPKSCMCIENKCISLYNNYR